MAVKRDDKREQILRVAHQCFSRYGYEKTTLQDIGDMARLNKASLYYYYKNKEDLFIQVVLREAEQFITGLQAQVAPVVGAGQKILDYLRARLSYYHQVLNLHQLTLENLYRLEPLFDEVYQSVRLREREFLAQLLEQGHQAGEFAALDATRTADALLTVADAVKHEAARQSPTTFEVNYSGPVLDKLTFTLTLLLRGLRP